MAIRLLRRLAAPGAHRPPTTRGPGRAMLAAAVALLSVLATMVVAGAAPSAVLAAPAPDYCGCTSTGPYSAPNAGVAPDVTVLTPSTGESPTGTYQYSVTTEMFTVTRGSTTVLSVGLVGRDWNWGFSPDDDRLLMWSTANQLTSYALYDLTPAQAKLLVQRMDLTISGARFAFSKHTKHLLAATTRGLEATITVFDAADGALDYEDAFTLANPPATPGDVFQGAAWGFSPDARDRMLLIGRTTSSQPEMRIVDLDTNAVTMTLQIPTPTAQWRFSPCGDALGYWSATGSGPTEYTLFDTANGAQLAHDSITSIITLQWRVNKIGTTYHHVIVLDGATRVLAEVKVAKPCGGPTKVQPAAPTGVTVTPAIRAATIAWTAPPTGADIETVTGYRITQTRGTYVWPVIDVPASTTSLILPDLYSSLTVTITAVTATGTSPASPAVSTTVFDAAACGLKTWSSGPTSGSVTQDGITVTYEISTLEASFTSTVAGVWYFGDGKSATTAKAAGNAYAYWGDYAVSLATAAGQKLLFILHVAPPVAAPGNDPFDAAIELTGADGTATGTTKGATCEPGEPLDGKPLATVWYRVVPQADQRLTLDARNEGVAMDLYTGDPERGLSNVPAQYFAGYTTDELRRSEVMAGVAYYLRISAWTANVDFAVAWHLGSPPPNDPRGDAEVLAIGAQHTSGSTSGSTYDAGLDDDEPEAQQCGPLCRTVDIASVWYTWTATSDNWLSLKHSGKSTVRLYRVVDGGALEYFTASDIRRQVHQVTGTTYYVQVIGYQVGTERAAGWSWTDPLASVGPFTLEWHVAADNDDWPVAQPISGATGSIGGDSTWAGYDSEAEMGAVDFALWYRWTAPESGGYAFTAASSSITHPIVLVFSGDTETPERISPTGGPAADSPIPPTTGFVAEAGRQYLIAVGGLHAYRSTSWVVEGVFDLSWRTATPPSSPRNVVQTLGGDLRSATYSWDAPESDGGLPSVRYEVVSVPELPATAKVTINQAARTAAVTKLRTGVYSISIVAHNTIGGSEPAPAGEVPVVGPDQISGVITDELTGAAVPGACLYLYQAGTFESAGFATCAAPDGSYLLTGMPDGHYKLAAFDPAGMHRTLWAGGAASWDAAATITIGVAAVTSNVVMPGITTIAGTVTTADGRPVAGACVYLYNADGTAYAGYGTCADDQGRYVLQDMPAGSYAVAFTDPAGTHLTGWYADEATATEAAAAVPVTVVAGQIERAVSGSLSAITTLMGHVTDAETGSPIEGVCVYLYNQEGTASAGYVSCTDSAGRYAMQAMPAGVFTLAFAHPTDGRFRTQWWEQKEDGAAATRLTLEDGAIHELDVVMARVPDAVPIGG